MRPEFCSQSRRLERLQPKQTYISHRRSTSCREGSDRSKENRMRSALNLRPQTARAPGSRRALRWQGNHPPADVLRRKPRALTPRGHGECPGNRRSRQSRGSWRSKRWTEATSSPNGGPARSPASKQFFREVESRSQWRRRSTRAQHHKHSLRPHRRRSIGDCTRFERTGRFDGARVLFRSHRTLPRANRHGPAAQIIARASLRFSLGQAEHGRRCGIRPRR
jgi:hypothetical protein